MKKFISMALTIVMVLSMVIVGTTTAFAEDTATAYFVNTDDWAQVNCYVYGSGGGQLAAWPGTAATLVDEANGVYAFEPGTYDKLIWNNGNGNGKQTANLDTANCIGGYYEPKTETIYPSLEEALTAAGSAISYEYYVIGSEGLCGINWAVSGQNGMTKAEDGTYTKTYENVPAGSYTFKIIDNDGTYHPDGMGNDSVAIVEVDQSTVIVTYDTTVGVGVAEVIAPTVDPTPSDPPETVVTTQDFCDALNAYFESVGHTDLINGGILTVTTDTVQNEITVFSETDGLVIFQRKGSSPLLAEQIVGKYKFTASTWFSDGNNLCGYCVYQDGVVYTIANAVEQGIVTDDQLAEVIPGTTLVESNPDTDETRPVVENELYVQFKSNIGAHSDIVLNTTTAKSLKATVSLETALLIVNGEGCVTYDPSYVALTKLEVLNVNNAITNVTGIQLETYKESYFNFTDPSTPADFSTTKPIVEMTFDVVNYGNTEIMFRFTELNAENDVVLVGDEGAADNFNATVELTAVENDSPSEPTEDPVVPSVVPTLSKKNISLKAAQTTNLTVNNANGATVKYSVKDNSIAKVSKNGKVTALKKGSTKITVTVGKTKLTCNVKVTTNPKLVNNKGNKVTKLTIPAGAKATKVYISGKVKSIKNSYSSNKTSVAKVSGSKKKDFIKVTGIKKGTAKITVKVNGVKNLKLKVIVK